MIHKKVAIIRLSFEAVMRIFSSKDFIKIYPPLPLDSYIQGVSYDNLSDSFHIKVSSKYFQGVREGEQIPIIDNLKVENIHDIKAYYKLKLDKLKE